MVHLRLKTVMKIAAAVIIGAGAFYLLLLCLSDLSGAKTFRITSAYTGSFLCPYSVLTFASALWTSVRIKNGDALSAVLPHAVMVLSLLTETLTVTNFFNHAMEFLTSPLSKGVFIIYAVLSFELAVIIASQKEKNS